MCSSRHNFRVQFFRQRFNALHQQLGASLEYDTLVGFALQLSLELVNFVLFLLDFIINEPGPNGVLGEEGYDGHDSKIDKWQNGDDVLRTLTNLNSTSH